MGALILGASQLTKEGLIQRILNSPTSRNINSIITRSNRQKIKQFLSNSKIEVKKGKQKSEVYRCSNGNHIATFRQHYPIYVDPKTIWVRLWLEK